MPAIRGPIAAAFTPRGKNDEVDFGALFELLDFLAKGRVAGVALFTAVGEYPSVSIDERTRLTHLAVKRSRLPVLAGVGSSTLADSVALAREARNAGAAALLLPPPYFYPLDQDDVREFYVQFAARLGPGIPTMLVNTPPLTAYIEPATARDLIASGHYAGLVDTDPTAASQISATVLSASDPTFLQARQAGASGALSELACAAPELMVALERTMCAGDWRAAGHLDAEVQRASAWLGEFPQSAGLKAAAGMRKLKTGPEISAPLTAAKQARMEEFRRWFPEWLAHVGKLTGHA